MKKFIVFNIILIVLYSCSEEKHTRCGLGVKYPYYYSGLFYQGELFAISEVYKNKYIPITNSIKNTGIITVFFDVNCFGVTSNFRTKCLDSNYLNYDMDFRIVQQVITIAKSLDNWHPGVDIDGCKINSFMFLSFRIVEGQIVEILPK